MQFNTNKNKITKQNKQTKKTTKITIQNAKITDTKTMYLQYNLNFSQRM